MTRSKFFRQDGRLVGFALQGHTDLADAGTDILCAAVSSAVYLAANTITDVYGCEADITVDDGQMSVRLSPAQATVCQPILEGLRLHLQALRDQYPAHIEVTILEGTSHAEH